jgi:hypothetical protein
LGATFEVKEVFLMNKFLAMVLCLAMPIAVFAGDNGYKVTYDGGSIPNAKSGSDMKLFIDPNQVQLVRDKGESWGSDWPGCGFPRDWGAHGSY